MFTHLRARKDARRLAARVGAPAEYARAAADARRRLAPMHAEYVASVSTKDMAASLEMCVFLRVLSEALAPRRILDLGSGFSSLVFRLYRDAVRPGSPQEAADPIEVISVDDSPEWLAKTGEFLASQGLTNEKLLEWEAFCAADHERFDLVFHDLGRMRRRAETLEKVLSLAAPHGAVILDDVHKKRYRTYARRALRRAGLDYYSLQSFLHDKYGRYAWLVPM